MGLFRFEKGYLCCGCQRSIKRSQTQYVYKDNCICKECFGQFESFPNDLYCEALGRTEFVLPAFRYRGLYREIFIQFKFNGCEAFGHLLAMAAADVFDGCSLAEEYSYIVPIPVSRNRMRNRGYNQAEIMAKYVSERLGIPIASALKRVVDADSQSTAATHEKADNVKGAFAANMSLDGERVILLDDIYTTGSTMRECTNVLLEAGAGSVCGIACGYVLTEERNKDAYIII